VQVLREEKEKGKSEMAKAKSKNLNLAIFYVALLLPPLKIFF